MPREDARTRGTRLLIEGRVIVTAVTATAVRAIVRGEGHLWHAGYDRGVWRCDCPARSTCSHLHAIKRVVSVDIEAER